MTTIRWKAANPNTILGCDPHNELTVAIIARRHGWPGWSLHTRHATTHGLNLPDAQTLARSTAH